MILDDRVFSDRAAVCYVPRESDKGLVIAPSGASLGGGGANPAADMSSLDGLRQD